MPSENRKGNGASKNWPGIANELSDYKWLPFDAIEAHVWHDH